MKGESKKCHFVTEDGCSVYEDRPWACRMYPLGQATPGETSEDLDEEFFFLLKEDVCKGFEEDRDISVNEWLDDQDINLYNKKMKKEKMISLVHISRYDME
jgi:Fe-S-cluster containining protein